MGRRGVWRRLRRGAVAKDGGDFRYGGIGRGCSLVVGFCALGDDAGGNAKVRGIKSEDALNVGKHERVGGGLRGE